MADPRANTEHGLADLSVDDQGWFWWTCECDWADGPFPGGTDALGSFADHIAEAPMADRTSDYWLDQRYDDALHAELERLHAENERLREALERAEPWLGYLIRVAADGWAPNEEAVLIRDREFIQAALTAPEESDG